MARVIASWRAARQALVLANEMLPVAQRRALARRRLLRVVRGAGQSVPYYRRVWEQAGIDPRAIRTPDDFRRLPVIDAADFRHQPLSSLVTPDTREAQCRRDYSSGLRAPHFTLLLDPMDQASADAVWLRSYFHLGVRPWHRRALVHRPDARAPVVRHRWGAWSWMGRPVREVSTDQPLDAQIAQLRRWRPMVLQCRPADLTRLIFQLKAERCGLPSVRLVICGGELLPRATAALCREILGVTPRLVYGSTEVGFVAWSCAAGNYHVNDDHVWCELLGDGADGMANLVVTTLQRRAMPMVRVRVGDVVRPPEGERCPCGSSWPLLGQLRGRQRCFVRLPSGRVLGARDVEALLAPIGHPFHFRVCQHRVDELEIQVERKVLAAPGRAAQLDERLRVALGHEIAWRVTVVDALVDDAWGKRSLVDSWDLPVASVAKGAFGTDGAPPGGGGRAAE